MSFGAKEGGFWTLKGGMGDTPTTAMTDRPPVVLKKGTTLRMTYTKRYIVKKRNPLG